MFRNQRLNLFAEQQQFVESDLITDIHFHVVAFVTFAKRVAK